MSYPGSKSKNGTVQQLIRHMPPMKTFIDGMTGGGSVARAVAPFVDRVVTNDYDAGITATRNI
jgi:site-specific DNA-adenine methylase